MVRKSDNYKNAHSRAAARWQKDNKEKSEVSSWVHYLRTSSHSDKISILYECPHKDSSSKHFHHFDYSRPLEVIALCSECHRLEHKRLREALE
jgi:hypothetical protein